MGVILFACNLPTLSQTGETAELLPRGSNPILVAVDRPMSGEAYPVGGAIQVAAEALGADPIVTLELWVNGVRLESSDFTGEGRTFVRSSWTWVIPTVDEHIVFVRAFDSQGRSSDSAVVHLEGIPDPGALLVEPAEAGDTLASMAAEHGVGLEELSAFNPIPPDAELPAGAPVFIPIPGASPQEPSAAPLPQPPASQDPAPPPPDSLGPEAPSPPAPPTLTLASFGCGARLYIGDQSSNEAGFYLYRLGPGASSFARIATFGSHDGPGAFTFDAYTAAGAYQFYASAFNAAGEAAGSVVPFKASPQACPSSQSGLRIEGDALILPQAPDLAFLYYSKDGATWSRLPTDPHAYLQPSASSIALGAILAGDSIELEVWGWEGNSLQYLGSLQTDLSASLPASMPNLAGAVELLVCPVASCTGDVGSTLWKEKVTVSDLGQRPFQWRAPMQGTKGGLWQVSTTPFGAACELTPPGLVLSDFLSTSGGITEFSIDFSPLAPEPVDPGALPAEQALAPGSPIIPGLPELGDDSLLVMEASPGLVLPGLGGSPGADTVLGTPNLVLPEEALLDRYYVRVLPIVEGQVQCQPSTTAIVVYDPTPPPPITFPAPDYARYQQQYEVKILEYNPPVFPDPNLWGCIEVLSVDVKPGDLQAQLWSVYIGKTVCPKPFKGGSGQGFGAFLNDLASAWDFIVDLYDKLSDLVKKFIAEFNPICLQAKWAADAVNSGQAKKTIEDACKAGAAIAVEAAKAYVGIPPSLPKWDQLDDLGKDYLVELAADEFTAQTGIPCDEDCKDLLRSGVDAAHKSLTGGGSATACVSESEAHQHGREPLCPPASVSYKAALGAEYIPPVAWVQVTRLPNAPEPDPFPACSASLNMTFEYNFPGGTVYGPYSPTGTASKEFPAQTINVVPYSGTTVKIPQLQPGQQVVIAVPFNKVLPVLFPWTQQMYKNSQIAPNSHGQDFFTAVREGSVTLRASTYFNEYAQVATQYPGAVDLPCAPPTELQYSPGK